MKKYLLFILMSLPLFLVGCGRKSLFSGFSSIMFVFKSLKWILILLILALLFKVLGKVIRAFKGVTNSVKSRPSTGDRAEVQKESSQSVDRVKNSSNF